MTEQTQLAEIEEVLAHLRERRARCTAPETAQLIDDEIAFMEEARARAMESW